MLITEYASTRMLSAVMPPLTCSGDANSVRTASAPSPVRPNRATMPSAKAESPGKTVEARSAIGMRAMNILDASASARSNARSSVRSSSTLRT
jgi:hypothetical protein